MDIVTIDDLKKLDIQIGKILSAEKIEGTDKLLKLRVSFGGLEKQIISGIAQFYTPDQLVGKQCPFIVNLKPRMLRGEESQGMLLAAASENGGAILLHPDQEVPDGTMIK